MKIAILTEFKTEVGIGHVVRCSAIYETFIQKGHKVDFIIDSNSEIELLQKQTYILSNWLSGNPMDYYDLIIIDTYSIKTENWLYLSKNADKIFYINDGNVVLPDLEIISIKVAIESIQNENSLELQGTKYFPLRKEIREIMSYNSSSNNILVMFGGTDIRELSVELLPIFKNRKDLIFNIVTANNKVADKIKKENNINIFVSPSIKELQNLLKNTKLAIVSGGTILYELAYLSIPSLVIEVIDNQSKGIQEFKKRKFIENYFKYNDKELVKKVEKYLSKMTDNYEYYKEKASIGKKIVNGMGTEKMIDDIMKIYNKELI